MDRRKFFSLFGLGVSGIALEQAIPFNRVWSFPKEVVIAQQGWRLNIKAAPGFALNLGDIFTMPTVYGCDQRTGRPLPLLRRFVVTRQFVASGNGNDTLEIAPAIYGPLSPYQNVVALPTGKVRITPVPFPGIRDACRLLS